MSPIVDSNHTVDHAESIGSCAFMPWGAADPLDGAVPFQAAWQLRWSENEVQHAARGVGSDLGRGMKEERAHG